MREPSYHRFFSSSSAPATPFQPPRRPSAAAAVRPYELDYKLHARGDDQCHDFAHTKRGVDHESYAYQLAVDMGAAPTWRYVLVQFGWEVLGTWAMGPNFNSKFRLVGPWSHKAGAVAAAELMRRDGELGRVVRRSGGGVCEFLSPCDYIYWCFDGVSL